MKYKVGDRVRIKSIDWYNENKDEYGVIYTSVNCNFYADRSKYCGKVFTIHRVFNNCYLVKEDNGNYNWTDEMIEGLVEEGTNKLGTALNPIEPKSNANCITQEKVDETKPKPKFKVGDKVKWFNHTCNIKSIDTDENTYTYLIKYDDYWEDATFAKWVPENELTFEDDEETYDFLKTDKPNRSSLNDFMDMLDNEIKLPIGYQFVDENGNVINATKIVLEKKKKEYPKTYEECLSVLKIKGYDIVTYVPSWTAYEKALYQKVLKLRELIICRDAYWKIAGEEMGLSKPWKPDWKDADQKRYVIAYFCGNIEKSRWYYGYSTILTFPTEEMRDAFYENFKEEIEICKELL